MQVLEERVELLEKILGLNGNSQIKAQDVDVQSVKALLEKKGLSKVLTVPIDRLKRLQELIEKPDSRSLTEKLTTVDCCADIVERRAKLLEVFEERLKIVLNCDSLTSLSSQEAELDRVANDVLSSLQVYKRHAQDLEAFQNETANLMSALQTYVHNLESKVAAAEAQLQKQE